MATEIEKAELVIRDLERKREALIEKRAEHEAERSRIAYQAHAQADPEASARLQEVADEAIRIEHELRDIDHALRTAQEKLAAAHAAGAAAARAADAEKLADLAETIRDVGRDLDAALFGITESGRVLGELIDEIHGLGLSSPNHQQAYSLGWRAIAAALMATPWRKEFPPVPPNDRKSFEQITATWAAMIENAAERLTGEQPKEREVA